MYIVVFHIAAERDWMVGENPGEMEDELQYILITAIVADEWAMDRLPIRVVPRSFFVPYFWDEEAFLVQINR